MTREYSDDTPMPFGKHKGSRLRHVPASYLLWWYEQKGDGFQELRRYIAKNKHALEVEKLDESYHDRYS